MWSTRPRLIRAGSNSTVSRCPRGSQSSWSISTNMPPIGWPSASSMRMWSHASPMRMGAEKVT